MERSFFILIPIFMMVLSGCALQMPVSEGLVFKDKDDPFLGEDDPSLPIKFVGGQLATSNRIFPTSNFRDATFSRHGSDSATVLNPRFLTSFSTPGVALSLFDINRFAVGFSPGVVVAGAHVDATVRAIEEIYITANHNISSDHFELIIQRPLFKKNTAGLSLGLFYRNEQQQFENEFNRLGPREESFRVRWFGVRTLGQSPRIYGWIINVRGHFNAGYVPQFDAALFTLGISFAIM